MYIASVHVCVRCSPIEFAAMTHHASQQNVGPFQEAQARRELLPKAGVAKHSVASRLSLKMRTSCFSHGRHRGNKDTNTTSVRFQHPRGSHDPRNYRTWTQVDISKFHTCLSVFLQFQIVAFGRSCNAGRKNHSPVQDEADSRARRVVTGRDAISLGPQWTCQSSTLAIGV